MANALQQHGDLFKKKLREATESLVVGTGRYPPHQGYDSGGAKDHDDGCHPHGRGQSSRQRHVFVGETKIALTKEDPVENEAAGEEDCMEPAQATPSAIGVPARTRWAPCSRGGWL